MLKNALRRLVTFSIDHPKTVIGIVLAVTLFFLFQLPKIQIDTDPENMLEQTQPERVFYAGVKKEFGINEFIVLGITDEAGIYRPQALAAIGRLVADIVKIEGVIVEDVVSLTTTDNIRVRDGSRGASSGNSRATTTCISRRVTNSDFDHETQRRHDMTGDWGSFGWWGMGFGMVLMLLFWVSVILGIAALTV